MNVNTPYNTRKSIDQLQGGASHERRFGEDIVQFTAYASQRSVTQYQSIPRALQLLTASTPADDPQRWQSGGVIDFDRDFSGLSARWIGRYELGGGRLTTTTDVAKTIRALSDPELNWITGQVIVVDGGELISG